MSKVRLLIDTVKYLKPVQVRYRIKYFVRNRLERDKWDADKLHEAQSRSVSLSFQKSINNYTSFFPMWTFEFLNIKHTFQNAIDWNYPGHGRLWTYNLNYFEFLNQADISKEDGLWLVDRFIESIEENHTGMEPYPISLRVMNWIKFFTLHEIKSPVYDNVLWMQLQYLCKNKEFHLLGNHLLENGFALLFGAYYFNDEGLYKQAKAIVSKELNEQVLNDGGHFELSPMYHCLMAFRVMDCYNLVANNSLFNQELFPLLKEKGERMLSFLNSATFKNGDIPLLNDAAFGIAPSPEQLFRYAAVLNLRASDVPLSDSGYRKLASGVCELFLDAAEVGPSYQPGHAHADTLSFELHVDGRPLIVDTGTSTYEVNETRFHERSSRAHNTVTINNENSSEVWAGHRVARRAKVKIVKDEPDHVIASHDGYLKRFRAWHTRDVSMSESGVTIMDDIQNREGIAHFHFAPGTELNLHGNEVTGNGFTIVFQNSSEVELKSSLYSPEFNKQIENLKLQVSFQGKLTTRIIIQ